MPVRPGDEIGKLPDVHGIRHIDQGPEGGRADLFVPISRITKQRLRRAGHAAFAEKADGRATAPGIAGRGAIADHLFDARARHERKTVAGGPLH